MLLPLTAAMLAIADETESHGFVWIALNYPGIALVAMEAAEAAGATRAEALDIVEDIVPGPLHSAANPQPWCATCGRVWS